MLYSAQDILIYWFGPRPYLTASLQPYVRRWFGAASAPEVRPQADELIRERFGDVLRSAEQGELDAWNSSPRRRLALIVVLDQFTRHCYRGTPRAYSNDETALRLSVDGLMVGADATLDPVERIFFYMPMQHAESLDVQDECVLAFRRLHDEAPSELQGIFADALAEAIRHRDAIARFGRFPHRNGILGRESTPEEVEWLDCNELLSLREP
jgi:uncharacterized protein (DUF924 family)